MDTKKNRWALAWELERIRIALVVGATATALAVLLGWQTDQADAAEIGMYVLMTYEVLFIAVAAAEVVVSKVAGRR